MVVELQHSTFKNLKVFITGTSSGIGHAVSKAYLERGSIVYGIDNKNNKSLNLQFKNFEFHNCNVQNYKKMSSSELQKDEFDCKKNIKKI